MMSQTHQMMSQQHQVEETAPEHSQKLFTASGTVNLTEKNVKLTPRAQQKDFIQVQNPSGLVLM